MCFLQWLIADLSINITSRFSFNFGFYTFVFRLRINCFSHPLPIYQHFRLAYHETPFRRRFVTRTAIRWSNSIKIPRIVSASHCPELFWLSSRAKSIYQRVCTRHPTFNIHIQRSPISVSVFGPPKFPSETPTSLPL